MIPNPIDKSLYPNCYSGFDYAVAVVCGDIPSCVYVVGACERFLKDWDRAQDPDNYFFFDIEKAEDYLKKVQCFQNVIGDWSTPENPDNRIIYLPWQNFVWMNIIGFRHRDNPRNPRFRVAHVELPRGQGKALGLDTPIPTPDRGVVRFDQIKVGDKVYSRDGKVCNVVGRNEIHYPDPYRIKFSTGEEVVCSGDHLWFTSNKNERDRERDKIDRPHESVKTTKEIFDTQRYGKEYSENNHSVSVTSPISGEGEIEAPYLWGYWIGNGSKRGVKFTMHEDDANCVRESFSHYGLDVGDLTPVKGKRAKTLSVRGIIDHLSNYLNENKTLKVIPESVFTARVESRIEFLRGLMDSDGTCHKKTGLCTYGTVYRSLADSVCRLVCSLGIKATIQIEFIGDRGTKTNTENFYRVSFTTTKPVFKLPRKLSRLPQKPNKVTLRRYISHVERLEDRVPMFCIEVDSPDKSYLITNSYIPTHNSAMASQACLYFVGLDKPLLGQQISCFSVKSDQSRIVLDSARAMAKQAKAYLKATGVEVQAHRIVHTPSNSFVRAMASDSNSMDGLNDVLAVMDELHAMDRRLFDVVYSGLSKRRDSIMLCITTAGFDVSGVGFSQSAYAKKVCKAEVEDDQFFSIVYTIDEGDDIFSEVTWRKANPSFGHSVDPISFSAKAKKARETPSDLPNFKTKHLNVWVSEAKAFFDLQAWDKCADPKLKLEDFYGKKCYAGIDLASKVDLTSFAYVFRENGIYYIFDKTYIPEQTVAQANSTLYDNCIGHGHLIATPGEAIHYPKLREEFVGMSRKVKILSALYDPWNATSFAQDCTEDRIDMVEFRMNTANLSEPTKNLDALIRQGKVRHNGSPLLRWTLGNVVCKEDAAGNVFPRKSNEKLKIDPVISIIMCIAQWMNEKEESSVYESRGILHL